MSGRARGDAPAFDADERGTGDRGALDARGLARLRWALLFGNFAIGCGVMVVVGTLADVAGSLSVSVAVAGQLVAVAALVMGFGAPLAAGWIAGFDRRRLLTLSLAWYAAGHVLCALLPSFATLLPVRALTVLGAAVFTPQAAAAINAMAPAAERGRSITFIFIGWSVASVLGMPLSAWLGDHFGWRVAFLVIGGLGAASALAVYTTVPAGTRGTKLDLAAWKSVFRDPVLMAMVAVTALSGAGQFTVFSYFAPYFKDVVGTSTNELTLLFVWFGIFGVIGNTVASRSVDRIGADRAVAIALVLIIASLLVWPWATTVAFAAIAMVPWALACFSSQSLQQVRLGAAAPALAAALMALNTSAIYLGQAIGASSGGWLIAHRGYAPLSVAGVAWLAAALATSLWAGHASRRAR